MIARKQEIHLQLNQLIDALILGAVFWLCHLARHSNLFSLAAMDAVYAIPEFNQFLWMLAVIMPFGPFLLELQGYYNFQLEKSVRKSLNQIARAGLWLVVLIGAAVILLRLYVPSRSVLLLFCLAAPAALLIKERLYIWIRLSRLTQGAEAERIIIAGELEKAREILDSFTPSQKIEIKIVEMVDLKESGIETLVDAIHRHNVGRVVLAFSHIELDRVQRAIEACEVEGVEAWLSADFIQTSVARPTYESLGRRPMLVFRTTPDLSWALMVKRGIDIAGAAVGLVVLSPLFLLLTIAVKLSSSGPAIFTQRRAGIHGRPFTMFKFRTMYPDAETRHAELQAKNEMSGPVFKINADPRVTPAGRWLRRTSLDELPQLVNVLLGDMSLVGPRPLPLYEVANFQSTGHRRRLSMKPGLTCLWQIRGRNNVTSFDEWVRMDLEYIDHWSLSLDFRILLGTIPAVLLGAGAR